MLKKTPILAIILCSIGIIFCLFFNPAIKPSSFTVNLKQNQQLVGEIYLPKTETKPYPTMILTHGINSSKESMTPLALELSRHGVAAVTFDFGNYGESYKREATQDIQQINLLETEAVFNYLKQFPQLFDQNLMGIGGHSMGGSVALDFAKIHPEIKTTILLAIGGEATPESPKNLLYAMGLYDELNPTWLVKDNLKEASNQSAIDGLLIGNFQAGNARKLIFSPRSDHFIAPYDGILIGEMVNWILQSFDLPKANNSIIITPYIIGMILLFLGTVLGIVCFTEKIPNLSQKLINSVYLILVIISLILTYQNIIYPVIGSNLLLFLLVSQWLVNYRLFQPQIWQKNLIILIIYGLLLSFSFLISAAIPNGLPEIVKHPYYLLDLPLFLVQWPFLIIYNLVQHLKQELFSYHTIQLIPSYNYIIVLLIITFFNNFLTQKIQDLLEYLIRQIRQPLKITGVGKISEKSLLIIVGLLLILAITLYYQYQKGLVTEAIERGLDGVKLFIQLLFMPALIFLGILRINHKFLH